ncbi:MAG TPA: polysaccharide deacetylase family protein [Ktedonobacterales bacterium]
MPQIRTLPIVPAWKARRLARLTTALALVAMITLGLTTVVAPPAKAAGASATAASAPAITGPFKLITRTNLGQTSIDGPALASRTSGQTRLAIAWTGTDPQRRLNVMLSSTGFDFGSKVILNENSPFRPALAMTPTGQVAIAWTGIDSAHTLNVLYDVYGTPRKLTLWGETSPFAPALAYENNALYLAWTGQNTARTLNVQAINVNASGLSKGAKTTLWGFGSAASPSLSTGLDHVGLILAWSSPGTLAVRFMTSPDGVTWPANANTLPETSPFAPAMMSFVASNMPKTYLAWTGTNSARTLNLRYTDSFPSWPATVKSTLDDTSIAAPQLAYIGGPQALLLAWTGRDTAHSVYVSVITPTSTCIAPPGVSPVSSQLIVYGNSTRKQVALTFDAGGEDGARAGSLLDTLAAANVKSTWFIEGQWGQNHRTTVQRVVNDGHELGNHTIDHPDLTTPARSNEYICYELGMTEQLVQEMSGKSTRPFFRPPYGAYNTQVLNDAANLGFRTVYWSIDPVDWDPNVTADQIVSRVLNSPNLKNGAIILMHAGSLHEPEALPRVIAGLQAKGYGMVTLSQLIA